MGDETILSKMVLFRGLSEAETGMACRLLNERKKSYRKEDIIFTAGERTEDLGLILSGSVTIESNDMWGNRTILNNVGKGGYFAETYAINGKPLMVDVVANEDCIILFLSIGKLIRNNSLTSTWQIKLIKNLLMITSNKNVMLSNRSFHTSPKTARGRIEAYLNSEAIKNHKNEFNISFDREQMADYLNLDRSALSRELSKMKKDGIIDYNKNHFIIKQAD